MYNLTRVFGTAFREFLLILYSVIICESRNKCCQSRERSPLLSGTKGSESYVEMARKQDGVSNECISNHTAITRLGTGFARFYRGGGTGPAGPILAGPLSRQNNNIIHEFIRDER